MSQLRARRIPIFTYHYVLKFDPSDERSDGFGISVTRRHPFSCRNMKCPVIMSSEQQKDQRRFDNLKINKISILLNYDVQYGICKYFENRKGKHTIPMSYQCCLKSPYKMLLLQKSLIILNLVQMREEK